MDPDEWEAEERLLGEVHAALVAEGVVVPLELGGRDEASWANCDLASFAENRLGELRDPADLDRPTRDRWRSTALAPGEPYATPRQRESEACYWIVRNGNRVGTLALANFCMGDCITAHSIYLRPQHRGRGFMRETLSAVYEELRARNLGLRLETFWTWQNAVRFYLRNGFWLRSWKRDLSFLRHPSAPTPVVTVGEAEATVAIEVEGRVSVVARARRAGSRLSYPEEPDVADNVPDVEYDARTTLALSIALAGWPLIRSEHHWHRCRTSDLLHPEALAERIQVWEAWEDRYGWRIVTPRIPELDYPTWAELEAL